jgi:predicted nucleic acid-binding protein
VILLLDTDVLLDAALDRRPFSRDAVGLLNALDAHPGRACVAWHSIANFYYLTRPKLGRLDTLDFVRDLCRFAAVPATGTGDVQYALDLNLADFEDALQVAAAVACRAQFIVTRNLPHYRKSPVPAVAPAQVLSKLLIQ